MFKDIENLKLKAQEARILYRAGKISEKEAKEMVKPYEKAFNEKSKELAEKYHVKAQKFSFKAYMR